MKKESFEKLSRQPHTPPVVLGSDEIGPVHLVPFGGSGWFDWKRPGRTPTRHEREFGTADDFLRQSVDHRILSGPIHRTKHATNRPKFVAGERAKCPRDLPVDLIQDGRAAPWTPAGRPGARERKVIFVPAAAHASEMNPGKAHAQGIEELALPAAEFTSGVELGDASDRAVPYRNEERPGSGRRFCDPVHATRRHASRVPLWLRVTDPEAALWLPP